MKILIQSIMIEYSPTIEECVKFNKSYAHQTIPADDVIKMMEELYRILKKDDKNRNI